MQDPTKLFRTEYTFYRNSLGEPTNLREIQRRCSDGSYDRTLLTYDGNGQLEAVTPRAVDPDDGLVLRRQYFPAGDPQVGRLREIGLELSSVPDPHLKRSHTYDARGFVVTVTDARNHTTDLDLDARGRLVQVRSARHVGVVSKRTDVNRQPLRPHSARDIPGSMDVRRSPRA